MGAITPKKAVLIRIWPGTFLAAFRASLQVFPDKFNQIDVVINPGEKLCTVTSHNTDTGEGVVTLEAALTGAPIETRMNHRYITDAMQSISVDSVVFSFTEPNRPMVIKGVGDASFTYLVMPMNR
jgi:DNA polymerase III sliding clamp (beta) subunit (PCNA family)